MKYLIIIFVFCISCTNKPNSKKLQNSKNIQEFETGFPTNQMVFNKDIIAFADFVTYKTISFFTNNGKTLFKLNLQKFMKSESTNISDFSFVNEDTIVLLSKNTNKVYFLNKSGEMFKKIDYSKLSLDNIELCSPIFLENKSLYLGISRFNIKFPTHPSKTDYLAEYKAKNNFPNILLTNDISGAIENPERKLHSFYSRFVKQDAMSLENINFSVYPDIMCYSSIFSDSVYVFNKKFKLINSAKINSTYHKINLKAISILEYLKNPDELSLNARRSSFISDFKYDHYRNLFYCLVRDKMDENYIPFSIIVLNEKLEHLTELKFDQFRFYDNFYISKDGLYVENIVENNNKRSFTKFTYE